MEVHNRVFVQNDPVNAVDPWGLNSRDIENGINPFEMTEGWAPRGGGGGRLQPYSEAKGPHSVFKRNTNSGKIDCYDTYTDKQKEFQERLKAIMDSCISHRVGVW